MKAYSQIPTYLTIGILAIALGLSAIFITPTKTAHAQSQSSAQQMILSLLAQIEELQALLAQLEGGQVNTSSSISIGDTVQVNGTRLSVRSSASGARLGVADQGAVATVIDGPRRVDGHTWWKLDYQSGPDGWSAGEWLRVQYSAQAPASAERDRVQTTPSRDSAGADGTLTVSVAGTDLEINVATDVTKAAAQRMCNSNLNAWRIQYSMRFGDKAIQCDWKSGSDTWSKAVRVEDGEVVDVVPMNAGSESRDDSRADSNESGETATLEVVFQGSGDQAEVRRTFDGLTLSQALGRCAVYKKANKNIRQDCIWNDDVIDSNGVSGTALPQSGITDPSEEELNTETPNATPVPNNKCEVGFSGSERLDPKGPYNHLCGTGEMGQVRYWQRQATRVLGDGTCSTRWLSVRSEYDCAGFWSTDSDGR